MNRDRLCRALGAGVLGVWFALTPTAESFVHAQSFDFERLESIVKEYTVFLKVQVEFSFGIQTNEHEQRLLGTVVTKDGLVMFDGSFLSDNNPFAPVSGFTFRSTLTRIEITTFDEKKYEAEYVGVDRFTRIAFARIRSDGGEQFKPIKFVKDHKFKVGDWLGVFLLLPEFVQPPLAADMGMISTLIETPEEFPLTIGFSSLEMASVLFDEQLNPVGLLGSLADPSASPADAGGLMESFSELEIPLLGVITGDRLEELITDPPQKGKVDRAWLGITMQALTEDIADFLNIDIPGGIIVNDVVRESPAEACGLSIGDVIYQVNSQQVEIDREEELPIFQRQVADMGAGTLVEFSVLRPSEDQVDTLMLLATLAAAPLAAADAAEHDDVNLEFKVRDLVFSDFLRYNVEQGSLEGVVVSEMKPGGLAFVGGLQLGDVIQRIDGRGITSIDDVAEAMKDIEQEQPPEVIFFVWRSNKTMFVNVKTDWD